MLKLVAGQLGAALAIAAVCAVMFDPHIGYSALVGGLIGVLPNYYLAGRLSRRPAGATAIQSLRGIYVGEFIKILFTIALFVIAIRLLHVEFLTVVLTYLAMMVVNWLALLLADLGERPRSPGTALGAGS
ncbi:MAG: ATP synthase subunit I [Gammaproteobacteria bacterium]